MSLATRVCSEFIVSWHSFLRRRTAVFFAFFFPTITVVISGVLVQTQPTGSGLFAKLKEYYIADCLAAVILFTPLLRVSNAITRHRDGSRLEKPATTPLSRAEQFLTHSLTNVVVTDLAALLFLTLSAPVTGVSIPLTPVTLATVPFVALGVTLFCGLGAVTGSVADSQSGVIAAGNVIVLSPLFLSEVSVTLDLLPAWFVPTLDLSPLMYLVHGVWALTYGDGGQLTSLTVLVALAVVFSTAGTVATPRTN